VVRELEQRQNAKGKRRAAPEEDLRISELSKPFQEASDLALSVLAKDTTGEHNPHSHRWSELLYKVRPPCPSLFPFFSPACRPRRRTTSMPSSTPPSKRPTSQKQTSTDGLPIYPTYFMRGPDTRQDRRLPSLRPHCRRTSHSGPRIRQNHAICFARSHVSTRLVRLRRSERRLTGRRARCCAHRMRLQASDVSPP
jgi:hypothetical protein